MFRLRSQRMRFDVNDIQSKRLEIQKDALVDVLAKYVGKEKTRDETREDLIAIRLAIKEGCR